MEGGDNQMNLTNMQVKWGRCVEEDVPAETSMSVNDYAAQLSGFSSWVGRSFSAQMWKMAG